MMNINFYIKSQMKRNYSHINSRMKKLNIDIFKLKANHEYQLVNHIIIIFIAFIRNENKELYDYYKYDIPLNLRKVRQKKYIILQDVF